MRGRRILPGNGMQNHPPATSDVSASGGRSSAARIVAAWRQVSGGKARRDPERRTLIACSGGCDSSALAIALASRASRGSIIIGHVVHDLRLPEQAEADARTAESLAAKLCVPFVRASVAVRAEGGNLEATARRLRYAALAKLAREQSCVYVATAHHADDQLETLLMRLARGAGAKGLGGIARKRPIDRGEPVVQLIRPMLAITHADAVAICQNADWTWAEDHTNQDTTRLRAAIRHTVVPPLLAAVPSAALRAVEAAEHMREIGVMLDTQAQELAGSALSASPDAAGSASRVRFDREALRHAPRPVLMAMLRESIARMDGGESTDRITQRSLRAAACFIQGSSGELREFQWMGARLMVHGQNVELVSFV
jgi:tRNA(Ile)-lysidine synthase